MSKKDNKERMETKFLFFSSIMEETTKIVYGVVKIDSDVQRLHEV